MTFRLPPTNSASNRPCKFGFQGRKFEQIPHRYPGVWATQKTLGPQRLVIAPATGHVGLMSELSKLMSEPFCLLYVLLHHRGAWPEGRYESPRFLPRHDLGLFMNRFGSFLESDGRHHFWIMSVAENDLLVYDNHNVIYAYGCLDQFKRILKLQGLIQADQVEIPYPHTHFFHQEFDRQQEDLFAFYDWRHFPLQREDDEA